MIASRDSDRRVVEGPFEGQFGTWFVDQDDAVEVLTYRLSLVGAALATVTGVGMAVLPNFVQAQPPSTAALDAMAVLFLASFGVSLKTIHIYMKPMHNMLKALWAGGALGSLAVFVAGPNHSLVKDCFEHSEFLLASGWAFVALTGLFFKEFACFQRWEASALFAGLPILTGGHFLHLLSEDVEKGLAVMFATVFVFFAARKFDQPLKADIGDKSIFEYLALQEKIGQ
ncbi:hypothetical protein GUITHDRAFT_161052 [Guillardia theta CCMP2712]|uniref:Uncharacterized protein n=1 Tax=Guillardia theta (strain CCMP2712) TaxID=905079 RepID=L1JZ13_GUITC|nr:hypothetical protein GUITHDRAFT_161052 [Guillardia theta CCMP2712]EKX53450.1 hypothetical protein GUITHDRAFT_161052 [Guillardia theta CCMP2712]|eukprot:XP_005840430.1 hypothetical protein GUITHDRAFT_161052 [Guillardia theta CCMP2712]